MVSVSRRQTQCQDIIYQPVIHPQTSAPHGENIITSICGPERLQGTSHLVQGSVHP